ncbi:MAG: class I SAM-dependent methyltransferase [bacterium]|nr:class I SAM-dependent methyltransferase [bacterium]
MISLMDIVRRPEPPVAWDEGDNIPWNDPSFSERMLREHLDQSHDLASRRIEKIKRHVDWIHRVVLRGQCTKILDLTCGPGFYTNQLAELGHECVGVDFSPASIAYATDVATTGGLKARYVEADVRSVVPGTGFGLVLLLWGQFNVFRGEDAMGLLSLAHQALARDAQLLLEPQSATQVKATASSGSSWRSSNAGLFSDRPHLLLEESSWEEGIRTSTTRYFIVDAESGSITRHAISNVAYDEEELMAMLSNAGFKDVQMVPSLTGSSTDADSGTFVLRATSTRS